MTRWLAWWVRPSVIEFENTFLFDVPLSLPFSPLSGSVIHKTSLPGDEIFQVDQVLGIVKNITADEQRQRQVGEDGDREEEEEDKEEE